MLGGGLLVVGVIALAFTSNQSGLLQGALTRSTGISGTCSYTPNPAQLNRAVYFTVTATGGAGSYTYGWPKLADASTTAVSTSNMGTYVFATSGRKYLNVTVTDRYNLSGVVACNVDVPVPTTTRIATPPTTTPPPTATPPAAPAPLAATCTSSPNPAKLNQSVTFTINATGGTPTYMYTWPNPEKGSLAGDYLKLLTKTGVYSFNVSGTNYFNVTVTDSLNATKKVDCNVEVLNG